MNNSEETIFKTLFESIDDHRDIYISNLKEAVGIPSVSVLPKHREDIRRMIGCVDLHLRELKAEVEIHEIGTQDLPDGTKIDLPPVILAKLGDDEQKPTILIYGHLDVQSAAKSDGWDTEPFEMESKNGVLYGRGTTAAKGPVYGWLHAVEAYQDTGTPLPVNLRFCFEAMEECGSVGLRELLISKKSTFLEDVDYVCISDCNWLGTRKPCLIYSLRGVCTCFIEVSCASRKDLYSGIRGGSTNEAFSDVVALFKSLVDEREKILVPGVTDDVQPLTDEELKLYGDIDFDVEAYREEIGTTQLLHSEKADVLMARWRYPRVSFHDIEGANSNCGTKWVIPHTVTGKFSISLEADQDPTKISKLFEDHLHKQFKARGSSNTMKFRTAPTIPAWRTDPTHPHFKAAAKAVQKVYHIEPDLTRSVETIPVTLTIADITGKNVLLLPMGRGDDGAHSQNEKLDIDNYIEGTKVRAAYFYEVGKIGKTVNIGAFPSSTQSFPKLLLKISITEL